MQPEEHMANEITYVTKMKVAKGSLKLDVGETSQLATMTGTHFTSQAQVIGNSTHEVLDFGSDLGTPGLCYLRNLDPTNYVLIGRDVGGTFYDVLKIKPGESQQLRWSTASIYAKANAAPVTLRFDVLED